MTNPLTLIPPRLRQAIYLAYLIGGIGVTYAAAKGYAGEAEIAAWSAFGALIGATAASNVAVGDS